MKIWMVSVVIALICFDAVLAENWEKFHSEDGIDLYRAPKAKSGIIPFKAEAIVNGSVEAYLKHLLDVKGRLEWAPKLDRITIHKKIGPNHFIYSEFYKTPWPATDRQFLLEGKVIFKSPQHILLKGSNSDLLKYKSSNHILCDVNFLNFELVQLKNNKTRLTFSFLGDMKGWMPNWLINLIQRKWPMRFIQEIRKRAHSEEPQDISIYNGLEMSPEDELRKY